MITLSRALTDDDLKLDFEKIQPGSLVYVSGFSGAGKSTLLDKLSNYLTEQNHKHIVLKSALFKRPEIVKHEEVDANYRCAYRWKMADELNLCDITAKSLQTGLTVIKERSPLEHFRQSVWLYREEDDDKAIFNSLRTAEDSLEALAGDKLVRYFVDGGRTLDMMWYAVISTDLESRINNKQASHD